MRNKFWFSSLQ